MGQFSHDERARVPEWQSIPDIFENHARSRPDALAVMARCEQRSYAELSARVDLFAARLADRLDDRSDGRERLVGVCLERDVDLPAWLLAILKVGAAYMPIDPTTPAIRVAQMIDAAQPALIVASLLYANVVAQDDVPVVVAEDKVIVPPPPPFRIAADTLAYVIFTSGSTGRPKGVEIEHGSLVALMAAMAISPGFAPGERMMGLTRISFDLSVPDMFLPFFVGGSLALVDLDVAADPERLAAAFDLYRPDVVQGTPSTWRALIESGWQGHERLRIFAGGEAVTRALADDLLPRCMELWNMYGPTETTVWSTSFPVRPGDGAISIGWPIRGVRVHVADSDAAPVPIGEIGEIVISGSGVARGYRNRADLTAERFVKLPDGSRAYRTGDLGRVGEDGALYCLGRLDDQVKLRGSRIELGDIEAALALHPAAAWCAVRLWTDPSGDPVLVGYLVPRQGTAPTPHDVKAFLATRIAPYMIPDRIVSVITMPLTPNGKVDRSALRDPFADAVPVAAALPKTDVETRLSAIWCDLLGIGAVTGQDDFFDLGGYSLMTVRLTRRIAADFGVKLALIEVMQHSTLAAMTARIERGNATTASSAMLLNADGTRPPLFWLDAGPRMRTIMRSLPPDQPAFALNTDITDEEALGTGDLSIAAIAARLRTQLAGYQATGPYYLGGWCRWGIVAFELARQLVEADETVGLLTLLDAERPGRPPWAIRRRIKTWLRQPAPPTVAEPLSFSQRVEIATRSYIAGHYVGDVLLLRPDASRGDAGWGSIITGRFHIAGVPGDHVEMVNGTSAQRLAAYIGDALLTAQNHPPSSGEICVPVSRGVAELPASECPYGLSDMLVSDDRQFSF